MQTNPLNSIETTLGNLCGSTNLVKSVAYKIRAGLVNEGFAVVKTDHVDRLHTLLSAVSEKSTSEGYAFDPAIQEALSIVEGWK